MKEICYKVIVGVLAFMLALPCMVLSILGAITYVFGCDRVTERMFDLAEKYLGIIEGFSK